MAHELGWTEHPLTGIRTARFAVGMGRMIRTVVLLERPAADFIRAARG